MTKRPSGKRIEIIVAAYHLVGEDAAQHDPQAFAYARDVLRLIPPPQEADVDEDARQ